jgi:hypothetical protein
MKTSFARLRGRLSFANVTSGLALFVALGGTSYAAVTLPADSVGSEQIRTGAVGTPEIRTGGVDTAEIHTGGVAKAEIKTGGVGAAELHTDSVRTPEIKAGAVKAEEIDKDAVASEEIKDGSIATADLSDAARSDLAGAPAVAYRAAVNKAGAKQAGNATTVGKTGTGTYTVDFGKDVSACVSAATLAAVENGAGTEDPDAGRVTLAPGPTATSVNVNTFDVAGTAADEPFHLIVSC